MTFQSSSIKLANDLELEAVKINHDINGNPRYYIGASNFRDIDGNFIRPVYAKKYRGKKFGAGWIFQSYNLNYSLLKSIYCTKNLKV